MAVIKETLQWMISSLTALNALQVCGFFFYPKLAVIDKFSFTRVVVASHFN